MREPVIWAPTTAPQLCRERGIVWHANVKCLIFVFNFRIVSRRQKYVPCTYSVTWFILHNLFFSSVGPAAIIFNCVAFNVNIITRVWTQRYGKVEN